MQEANDTTRKVRELQEKLGHAAKTNRKGNSMPCTTKYTDGCIAGSMRQVRSKKGAAGIDKQTLQDIEEMGVQEFR